MIKVEDLYVAETVEEFRCMLPSKIISRRMPGTQTWRPAVLNCTCTHDIETSNRKDFGIAYSFALNVNGCNALFRYFEDYANALEMLVEKYAIDDKKELHIHVHNLGYEMTYELQLLAEQFGIKSGLWTGAHKSIQVKLRNGIVFLDSLKLFQKSLAGATKNCPHAKAVGDLDYDIFRWPNTELTAEELKYIIYDVQGLYEAIEILKKENKYTQASLPLTNTARVVRDVRKKASSDIHKYGERCALPKDAVIPAYKAMSGGDTHGSRWKSGITFEFCNSADFKSAHPSQILTKRFPCTKPAYYGKAEFETLFECIQLGYMFFGLIAFTNLEVLPDNPDPTISLSKTDYIETDYLLDNGRVTHASGVAVYMDSNDFIRTCEGYTFDSVMGDIWISKLEYLPRSVTDCVFDWYLKKEDPTIKGTPEYTFAKICVNTIYGSMAQRRIRDEFKIEADADGFRAEEIKWIEKLVTMDESQVSKKQLNNAPFLWGSWVASCSRLELWKLLKIVGWENVIYWDTDSCKYQGPKCAGIEEYNRQQKALVMERGYYREGLPVIGSAEDEHPQAEFGYQQFRFLHAKCYADRDYTGKLECTIAGVGKKEGVRALADNIDNLADGLRIYPAGGQKLWYFDKPIQKIKVGDRWTQTAGYIYMEDRDYIVSHDSMDAIFRHWERMEEFVGEIIAE